MMKIYHDQDADIALMRAKRTAIIGYGGQGHAHALNLRDSGVPVIIGAKQHGAGFERAKADGFEVMTPTEAAKAADLIMMLVPDEVMAEVYQNEIAPHLTAGKALAFAHGLNVHFKKILPPPHVNVFMVAPKGPGRTLRSSFLNGSGLAGLFAIHQDHDQSCFALALSYAKAIGCGRIGVFQSTFQEETECDLFGEQAVLCGGVPALVKAGFETLVEAGFSPEMAYFECLHELKLITDLLYEGGLTRMVHAISNTAEFGGYLTGAKLIDSAVKNNMKEVLRQIQSGQFADELLTEFASGGQRHQAFRDRECSHPIEKVGAVVRKVIGIQKD
jgi:ketol-acid reductoisomerase